MGTCIIQSSQYETVMHKNCDIVTGAMERVRKLTKFGSWEDISSLLIGQSLLDIAVLWLSLFTEFPPENDGVKAQAS